MRKAHPSAKEGPKSIAPWSYSARIPESASSRNYAFAPLVVACLVHGTGVFLGHDIAQGIPFWSNAVVWAGLAQALTCLLIAAWMFWGHWNWTAPQLALFGVCGFGSVFWAFQFAPLMSFLLYGHSPLPLKLLIAGTFFGWHLWWNQGVAMRCLAIWNHPSWRPKVWIEYEPATVYRRSAAKTAMDAMGVKMHPGLVGLCLPVAACIPLYFYRQEVLAILNVPLVPLLSFLVLSSIFTLLTSAMTSSVVMMFVLSNRVMSQANKPVLVDMMSPSQAPT
jgi:hypothetical protein